MYELVILIVIIILLIYYVGQRSEKFTSLDNDNYALSKYDNIDMNDLDMSQQLVPLSFNDPSYNDKSLENDKIDNSDLIAEMMTRGTGLYQPNDHSYSPIHSDSYDNPYKVDPNKPLYRSNNPETYENVLEYDSVLSGQQNMDEMLARKQQQRSDLNKRSIDGKVRATKNLYSDMLQEELNENEQRVWYSSEAQDVETEWASY